MVQGTREVQFREFALTPDETRNLVLALDRDQNLLRQIGEAIPADGVEQQIILRGLVMVRAGPDGMWTVVVPLRPGEYEFAYVVDGHRWMEPPAADNYVSDGFGRCNGVVVVH